MSVASQSLRAADAGSTRDRREAPVALVGGPLTRENFGIFDMIEAAGGRVVLDATDTGERTMPAPLDRRRFREAPLMELADMYFGGIPDAFRRPNDMLYEYLRREFADRGVRGAVLVRWVWCDLWHAEVQRMKESFAIPFVDVDLDASEGSARRNETRIQSLLDMLR